MADCLFCKIRDGEIPAKIVLKNDRVIAFRDISPQAPTHILIIPTKHIASLGEAGADDGALLGELQLTAQKLARDEGLTAYRTVINTGSQAGQSVFHLHVHLLGGRTMTWPPG